jgi:hypothetical protein
MQELAGEAYHRDREPSATDYQPDYEWAPDDVNDRLTGPLLDLLEEIRQRFLREAELETASMTPDGNQRSLTWSSAATLVSEFMGDFEFTSSPDLQRSVAWWRQQRVAPHAVFDPATGRFVSVRHDGR